MRTRALLLVPLGLVIAGCATALGPYAALLVLLHRGAGEWTVLAVRLATQFKFAAFTLAMIAALGLWILVGGRRLRRSLRRQSAVPST